MRLLIFYWPKLDSILLFIWLLIGPTYLFTVFVRFATAAAGLLHMTIIFD